MNTYKHTPFADTQHTAGHHGNKTIGILLFWYIFCAALFPLAALPEQERSQKSQTEPVGHIVTSIPPLEGLVRAIVDEEITVTSLIHGDPHTFIPRPSDVLRMHSADALFIIDPSFEASLLPLLQSYDSSKNLVVLSDIDSLRTHPLRNKHDHDGDDNHEEDGDHEEDHDDDGDDDHETPALDYHLWLDPYNVEIIVQSIAQKLKVLYPEQNIEQNLQRFLQKLAALRTHIADTLSPVQDTNYLVVHDGLQYFESAYNLKRSTSLFVEQLGVLSGARTIELIEQIRAERIRVLFIERQYAPSTLGALAERAQLYTASVDPLGLSITMDRNHYFVMMETLAQAMHDALIVFSQ